MPAEIISERIGEAVGVIPGLVLLVLGAVWLLGRWRGAGRPPSAPLCGASRRCAGCGLSNFSTAEACKRCGLALSEGEGASQESPDGAGAAAAPRFARLIGFAKVTPLVYLVTLFVGRYVHFAVGVAGWAALLAGIGAASFVLFGVRGDGEARDARRGARRALAFNLAPLILLCLLPLALLLYVRGQMGPTWQSFESYEGRFTVDLPGRHSTGSIRNDFAPQFGTTKAESFVVDVGPGGLCNVTYETLTGVAEGDPRELMEQAARRVIERTRAEVLDRRALTHEGLPALEFDLLVSADARTKPARGLYRIIWATTHAYSLALVGPENGELYAAHERFLASFHVLTPGEAAAEDAAREPARRSEGQEALNAAARRGDLARVLKLLEEGAAVNPSEHAAPLLFAVRQSHPTVVRALIAAGADVNLREAGAGDTLLHGAAGRCGAGGQEVLAALVEAGADVNARNAEQEGAVMSAAVTGCPASVRLLVAAGADLAQRNRRGQTPLGAMLWRQRKGWRAGDAEGVMEVLRAAGAPE